MKQLGLSHFTDLYLTSIGLLIFFIFFVAMVMWVFRKQSQNLYSYMEKLPIEGGND